jgi:heptosyltransferase-2
MSLPVLDGLLRLYPDAAITVAARRGVAPVFQELPEVAEILQIPAGRERWAWFRSLPPGFDLGVALPNSLAAAAGLWLAGAPERLGYAADGRSLLLTRVVTGRKQLKGLHQVYYYLGLLTALGDVAEFTPPRLSLSQAEKFEGRDILEDYGLDPGRPLVALGPGAAYGPAKRWPPERFAAVAAALEQEYGAAVVLLGGPDDRGAAAAVMVRREGKIVNLAGQTGLRQALGVLAHMRLLITNDSGLMHAAAALGTPLIALFGSTDPVATGPFSDRAVVLRHPLPCSPCFKRTCETGYPCLTAITVAEVLDAARPWLKEWQT